MAQIGVNAWVWTSPVNTDEFGAPGPMVSEMGFDLIEFGIEGTSDLDYRARRRSPAPTGWASSVCAAMGPDRDLIHSDESIRATAWTTSATASMPRRRWARRTSSVRSTAPSAGRGRRPTTSARRIWICWSRQLKELSVYAADRGVGLGVEPLNRFETSFLNLQSQAIEVVDRVDHPACGLLLDTFHMNIEERSIGDAIRAAGKRVRQLHTCENDRGAPGSGHVPWQEVAKACRDIGFNGPFVIESFTNKVKSIARAAAIWRNFAPTQDALAEDGLKFLRKLLA